MTKILLADDHTIVRQGLRTLLEQQKNIEVVAEAGDGLETIQLTQKHKPDIVIMDITMPGMNGIEATREILTLMPDVKVIALSMHSDKHFVANMLKAGAKGYLRKNAAADELVDAVHSVMKDQIYLSQKIIDVMARDFALHFPAAEVKGSSSLTPKERQVLQMIAEGKPTKDIAHSLNTSVKTVEKHRQHVMEKLNVHSVAELTKYAIREGLTSLEE